MTPIPPKPILTFGGFVLDVRQRSLIGPRGTPIDISSRAFDTLCYLAAHPHELIDKHRLMAAVWPNRVVEENNLSQQISSLRKLLGEAPGGQRFIVTVTGHGYRFVQDVTQLESWPVVDTATSEDATAPRRSDEHGGARRGRAPPRPVSASAVAAGAAAITLLLGSAFFAWRGVQPVVDTRLQMGAAMPATGGTRSVEAYDAYVAARAVINRGGTPLASEAIPLLERAIELDPDFALAWAALAEAYTYAADFTPPSALALTPVEIQQRVSRAVLRAFELAPDAPQTLRSAGMVSMQNRDWRQAERRLRRAVEVSGPYDYETNLLYALFLMNVGRTTDAHVHVERAMRAEPLLLRPVTFMAAVHEMRDELDEAEALLRDTSDLAGDGTMRRNALVMVQLGRRDAAGLRRVITEYGLSHELVDDSARALQELRRRFADAVRDGATARLLPLAGFASFHGDQALAMQMLRAVGSTQNLHALWRPALRELRRQPGFEEVVDRLGLVDYWRLSGEWGDFCSGSPSGGFACE